MPPVMKNRPVFGARLLMPKQNATRNGVAMMEMAVVMIAVTIVVTIVVVVVMIVATTVVVMIAVRTAVRTVVMIAVMGRGEAEMINQLQKLQVRISHKHTSIDLT